jgi:dihydroorotase
MNAGNRILIKGGWVLDPASGLDDMADVAIANGLVLAIKNLPPEFSPDQVIDATGCIVVPGLIDLAVRLGEPGHEHAGRLASELAAAVAGGVTGVVCPPDTDPVLDEPGLVQMLRYRSENLKASRVFPLGALTRNLRGEVLTEMLALAEAGCVAFSQAEIPLANTQVMLRALQYASTYGFAVWLRPQELHLGHGVAASGPLATRMGLSGVPVAAETIAMHTIFELMKSTSARVHLCRISSAAGVALVRKAKADGLNVTCDISINSLHLMDTDLGYFDSRMRLNPPLRQQRDRDALRAGLADGTIDALVSDHTPVAEDAKALPFAEAEPGATGLELLLSQVLKWSTQDNIPLSRALQTVTQSAARVLGASSRAPAAGEGGRQTFGGAGELHVGGIADICIFDPKATWVVEPGALRSQGKHTPFSGYELPGRVRCTLVGGQVAFQSN